MILKPNEYSWPTWYDETCESGDDFSISQFLIISSSQLLQPVQCSSHITVGCGKYFITAAIDCTDHCVVFTTAFWYVYDCSTDNILPVTCTVYYSLGEMCELANVFRYFLSFAVVDLAHWGRGFENMGLISPHMQAVLLPL